MKNYILYIVIIVFMAGFADAAQLAPNLLARFDEKGGSESLPALLFLSNRVDAVSMADRLESSGLSLTEIHMMLMDSLKQTAALAQLSLLNSLKILEESGIVKNIRPFWITNCIAVEMTRAAADLLITREEIESIGLDVEISLRDVSDVLPSAAATNQYQSGLACSHIPEVWALGYTGKGRLVCSFDNGVDATHPALKYHWRGNTAPATECWWQPDHATVPSFCGPQGTMTMSILCGANGAKGDTVGAAPAAEWIGGNVLCKNPLASTLIAAYQWAADPDNNSSTTDDVPDVVNNSWGTRASCQDLSATGLWEAMDNMEAMGPVNIVAVNNDGQQGAGSVGNPESRAASATRSFSVGNLNCTSDPKTINPTSGRGPSTCDNTSFKPELTAPGTAIRTCTPGGGYSIATGTTLASAQVAGIVALLRQVNPNLTAEKIKQLLLQSATDLGSSGDDNEYGHGMVNALAAIQEASANSTTGSIQGEVSYGGQSIPNAGITITAKGLEYTGKTNSAGIYRVQNLIGNRNYKVTVGRFGFALWSTDESVHIPLGGAYIVNANLKRGFDDKGDYDQGWTLGVPEDNATKGIWVRAIPVPSSLNGQVVQPGKDHSSAGSKCYVTGNAPSPNDPPTTASVSGGRTTLRSPLFDASELINPTLHFAYFYTNDQGENTGGDFFHAQISNDGGVTWKDLINSSSSTRAWQVVNFALSDFVTPSSQMMIQFIAEDNPPASLVEALVDDISITGERGVPEPPADLILNVQFDQVVLKWRSSEGATGYRVYLAGEPDNIVKPEHFYSSTADTTIIVPLSDIPYSEFYFQVTATNK